VIVKSMSRKVASFGQLIGYIDRDAGQEAHRIRRNVWGRDPEHIRAEFARNGDLLSRRKNGVYLYHEIISITRAKGLTPEQQKDRLQSIAETYIAARCPDNMVFGGLHQDKDHSYHYHLMISSNRAGETGRLRLTKAQFREVQVGLERHVLETYPELEQKVAIEKRAEHSKSRGEAELERRTGEVPKKNQLRARLGAALESAQDRDSLMQALGRENFELYVRGKTLGVTDHETGQNHRLKTLGLELADRVEGLMMEGVQAPELGASEGEKEKEPDREAEAQRQNAAREAEDRGREDQGADYQDETESEPQMKTASDGEKEKQRAAERADPEADNQGYVDRDSKIDLNQETFQQKPDREQERHDQKQETEMGQNDGPIPPGKDRREFIDKGHVTPDPERDLMSHEEWREQDTFLGKFKQSWRRTFDDFRGRTKDLEEKAQGKEPSATPSPREKPHRETGRSAQQEKWRSEMSRSRAAGRDDPEQGRE